MVGGGGLESDFSVHLWSKALASVGTKLNNCRVGDLAIFIRIPYFCTERWPIQELSLQKLIRLKVLHIFQEHYLVLDYILFLVLQPTLLHWALFVEAINHCQSLKCTICMYMDIPYEVQRYLFPCRNRYVVKSHQSFCTIFHNAHAVRCLKNIIYTATT